MNDVEDALESNSITEDEEYEFTAFDKNKLRDQFSAVKRQVVLTDIFSYLTDFYINRETNLNIFLPTHLNSFPQTLGD